MIKRRKMRCRLTAEWGRHYEANRHSLCSIECFVNEKQADGILLTVSGTKPSDSSPMLKMDSSESMLPEFLVGEKNLT